MYPQSQGQIFRPAAVRRTVEDVIEQVAEALQAGDLVVGDRLPSERTLASQMRISRPSVREAVRRLSEAGVVDVKPGPAGGMFIQSDHVPADLLGHPVELSRTEVSNILEARRMLEPRVAQLAALRATDADFEAMDKTIELQREKGISLERFIQLDIRFHVAIARATQNETVVGLMRSLLRRLEIARRHAKLDRRPPSDAVDVHVRTMQAIMSGDPDAVEQVMDEHLGYLEKRWQSETGRARVRRVPDFLLPLLDEPS